MKHEPLTFGRADRSAYHLRATLERRRHARQAALAAGAVSLTGAIACGILAAFEQCSAAVLAGLVSALAIVAGVAAASEA
jgi:hypothetical protein